MFIADAFLDKDCSRYIVEVNRIPSSNPDSRYELRIRAGLVLVEV